MGGSGDFVDMRGRCTDEQLRVVLLGHGLGIWRREGEGGSGVGGGQGGGLREVIIGPAIASASAALAAGAAFADDAG